MATDQSEGDAVMRRTETLGTIAVVLLIERRDQLPELPADQDGETLRHSANEGMSEDILLALTSDLADRQA